MAVGQHRSFAPGAQPVQQSSAENAARDIHALNSSILIISQKIQFLVRNEKIIGRNLMVLNKKIKELEDKGISGGAAGGASGPEFAELKYQLSTLSNQTSTVLERLSELQSSVERIKETYAKDEAVKELKYIIDSINPLEFVTYKDVEGLIEEKLKALQEKTEAKAAVSAKKK